jgi:hypothetical protein
MRTQRIHPPPASPPVHVIRLAGEPSRAFDLAGRAEEAGRACTERLRGLPRDGGDEAVSVRHLARTAAHLARQALGEQ